jgi:uncharacterized protein
VPSRRQFLRGTTVGIGVGLPFAALSRRVRAQAPAPLIADPNGIFDLAAGYGYRIVQRRGEPMSDGFLAPGKMDGMMCVTAKNGDYIVLRNQELNAALGDEERPFPKNTNPTLPACTYDAAEPGGVVKLVLDRTTLALKDSRLVLYGTFMNCAGGASPWGWLTCEEIDDTYEADASLGHGYVFLVRPSDDGTHRPRPIRGYGRFRHEAAVVVDETLTCYLTEDRSDSALYRFVPESRETPFKGVLQALKVTGTERMDLGGGLTQGQVLNVEWVNIDDPRAVRSTTRSQAQAKGAAVLIRGEGIARQGSDVYVCSTTGGPQALGQIFRYRDLPGSKPFDPETRGTLELVLQNEDESRLAQPDNIVVAPWGDLYMCEDASNGNQHLRWLAASGEIHDLGRNALSSLELAGVCFSPDGRVLFVNLQHDGIMLAITGPFPRFRIPGVAPKVDLAASSCNANVETPTSGMKNGLASLAATAVAFGWRRFRSK